jgi:hypothetical protein
LTDSVDNPEAERIAELARAVREGRASEAEREEIALYGEAHPQAKELAVRIEKEEALGGDWLARAQADERLAAVENTPFTRAERALGVALVAGGVVGSFFFPPAAAAIVLGGVVLGVSVLRVKLRTVGQDPYSKIQK